MLPSKNLNRTVLSQSQTQTITTAGVVCFSIEPKTRNIYILLGNEKVYPANINKWCDFGGKPTHGESIIETTAREFSEESLCCIRLDDHAVSFKSYVQTVANLLKNRKYFMKIVVVAPEKNKLQFFRVYYVIRVPWQPEVSFKFKKIREGIQSKNIPFCLRLHPAVHQNKQPFLEKNSIEWWSLERLNIVLKTNGLFKKQQFKYSFLPALKTIVTKLLTFYTE